MSLTDEEKGMADRLTAVVRMAIAQYPEGAQAPADLLVILAFHHLAKAKGPVAAREHMMAAVKELAPYS